MCYGCYELHGKPAVVNEKTKLAAEMIKNLYDHEGCGVGGYAHIVVDDWNLDDNSIDHCISKAKKGCYDYISESGRVACLDTLSLLKQLSPDERYSALAIADGFLTVGQP